MIIDYLKESLYNDDDFGKLEDYIKNKYSDKIVQVAQKVYDDWINSKDKEYFQDEYAGGGICHLIADEIINVLGDDPLLEVRTISYDNEVHVATMVKFSNEEPDEDGEVRVVTVDIPWRTYETGGGYNFEPIEDVIFTKRDITYYSQTMSIEDWESEF